MKNKKEGTVLVIDDEEDILLTLRLLLKRHFARVVTEKNPHHLPRLLRMHSPDIVILDMNFRPGDNSGSEGLGWLEKAKELHPSAHVIMMTAYGEVQLAVEALKKGATDFIVKPWKNEKLLATINACFQLGQAQQQVNRLKGKQEVLSADLQSSFSTIIGESEEMKKIFRTIEKVAKTDANVLILGENGTGKELIARSIHRQSPRIDQTFVSVDLGAIPDTLFESELFGHKKGAFTDANADRMGRFEAADQGSLFLDEIGNLSLAMQAKLLTALQNRQVRRVGSNQMIDIDIRLICATNMPLYDMVRSSEFRQDLLYRINTVEITLPPLRDRRDDLELLVNHFVKLYGKKYNAPNLTVHPDTLRKLMRYDWPGNIRELRHAVERAIILADNDELSPDDFLLQKPNTNPTDHFDTTVLDLEEIEKRTIQKALTIHQGNITKAADDLGLTRGALYRRLEKYGL